MDAVRVSFLRSTIFYDDPPQDARTVKTRGFYQITGERYNIKAIMFSNDRSVKRDQQLIRMDIKRQVLIRGVYLVDATTFTAVTCISPNSCGRCAEEYIRTITAKAWISSVCIDSLNYSSAFLNKKAIVPNILNNRYDPLQ